MATELFLDLVNAGLWDIAHLPFIMGYIVVTAALSRLVLATDVPNAISRQLAEPYRDSGEDRFNTGVRFSYCHGLAVALLSMAAILFSHEHKKLPTIRLHKNIRLVNHIAACIILSFLPMAQSLRSLDLISITLGLSIWVLVVELWESCTDDPFIGEKDGCCITYHANCKMDHFKKMDSPNDSLTSGEVLELGREKSAV